MRFITKFLHLFCKTPFFDVPRQAWSAALCRFQKNAVCDRIITNKKERRKVSNVATNTGLTRALAVELLKKQEVLCPNCGKSTLVSRYAHKKQNVEYKCTACKEIYHPCKLI